MTQLERFWTTLVMLGACAIAGCAVAEPIIRLDAAAPARWQQGRAVQQAEDQGIYVALAYDRNLQGQLAFRLEVLNQSDKTVLFDPAAVWAKYCIPVRGSIEPSCTYKRWLADPEAVMLAMEKQQSLSRANNSNTQAFMAGLLILTVTADVASAAKGRSSSGVGTYALLSSANASAGRESQEMRFASALDFWQAATFRRTSMAPGEAGAGLIVADVVPTAVSMTIYVPIAGKTFPFVFKQHSIDPRPPVSRRYR